MQYQTQELKRKKMAEEKKESQEQNQVNVPENFNNQIAQINESLAIMNSNYKMIVQELKKQSEKPPKDQPKK